MTTELLKIPLMPCRIFKTTFLIAHLHQVCNEVLASYSVEGRPIYPPFTEEAAYESTRFTQSEVKDLLGQFVEPKDVDPKVDETSKGHL